MPKTVIQKGSVQETLVIPLYARYHLAKQYPELYEGGNPGKLIESVDYDFSEQAKLMDTALGHFGSLEVAQREFDLCEEARAYLRVHPNAAVVNLGCGLLDLFSRADNGSVRGYNLDFPDVIDARNELMPAGKREHNIACDLNDYSLFDKIDGSQGAIFLAAGVFYYLTTDQVRALLCAMAEHFFGGVIAFDSVNRIGLNMMSKTVLNQTGMDDIGAYFCVSNASRELADWSNSFASVTAKSYMNGYRKLGTKYGVLPAILSWLSDHLVHMSIVRIEFKDKQKEL